MTTAVAAPGTEAPAALPAASSVAVLAVRPVRVPRGEPAAAVVLVEIEVKGLE